MTRTSEAMEGLALLGLARVGPIAVRTPGLAEPAHEGELFPGGLQLAEGLGAAPGHRALRLGDGTANLEIGFAVPTAEISGVTGGAALAGPETWFVHWPVPAPDAELLRAARPSLVILGNARALLAEGAPFLEAIRDIRKIVGGGPLLWAPRVALPHRVASLAYLGVDLLDSTEALVQARAGVYFDLDLGSIDRAAAGKEGLCDCPACRRDPPAPLEEHASALMHRELTRVRAALRAGRLRELVEARQTAEPLLAELLRYADVILGEALEERTPVVGDRVTTYVLRESHRRPEVVRYRDRFLERYRPPPAKRVLLLVPCSRSKPYRLSRSHRRFSSALVGVDGLERLHTVSVTSPLGLVPRELEDTYPCRHYDIPVTGDWDEGERAAVRVALRHLVASGRYDRVVVHLEPKEYSFLADILPPAMAPTWTMLDHHSTTPAALSALGTAVRAALEEASGRGESGPMRVVREELRCVAAFQFGADAADRLFAEPVRLAGRPWFQRVTDGAGTDFATWQEARGIFHLTVAGGDRLAPADGFSVEVDPRVPMAGDLFAPGVIAASAEIRTGDAVVLFRSGELVAVGEAALPGPLMAQLSRGTAVWVRHRRHAAVSGHRQRKDEEAPSPIGPVV
jgi:archaeosine synthase